MDTIKKAISRHNYIAAFLFLILASALMLTLSACGTNTAATSDPKASAAEIEAEEPTVTTTPPPVNDFVKQFGDVATYADGVSISVSAPAPFTPSNLDYMPLPAGTTAVVFKVVLTNNSTKPLDPGAIAQANSGGKPATLIADVGNTQYTDLGLFPTTTILPGQTLEWYVGFAVADPADITLEIAPYPLEYDKTIFTNVKF